MRLLQYVNLRMDTSNCFFDGNRNTTLIWKGIRQIITLKSKSKVHTNIAKVKDKDITNPTEIAHAFQQSFYRHCIYWPYQSKTIPD